MEKEPTDQNERPTGLRKCVERQQQSWAQEQVPEIFRETKIEGYVL